MQSWIPPKEATTKIDWKNPPIFRVIPKSYLNNNTVDLRADLYISNDEEEEFQPQEIASPPVPEYIYTVTTLETALKLAVYSSYEGLEG